MKVNDFQKYCIKNENLLRNHNEHNDTLRSIDHIGRMIHEYSISAYRLGWTLEDVLLYHEGRLDPKYKDEVDKAL